MDQKEILRLVAFFLLDLADAGVDSLRFTFRQASNGNWLGCWYCTLSAFLQPSRLMKLGVERELNMTLLKQRDGASLSYLRLRGECP